MAKKNKNKFNNRPVDYDSMEENKELRNKHSFKSHDILIGSVGNIKREKGYNVLLEAASILRDRNRRVAFFIVGKYDENDPCYIQLKRIKKNKKLDENVKFMGYQNDISNFLKTIDIYVLPSITEGFSLSTIEAMACGIPVIVTKSGGPEEIVTDKFDGILVPHSDKYKLANTIEALIDNKEERIRLGNNAVKTVRDSFSISIMISKYEKIYSELLRHNFSKAS